MDPICLLKNAAFIGKIVVNLCADQVAKRTAKMAESNLKKTALDGVERNDYRRIHQIAEMLGSDYARMAALYTKHSEAAFLSSLQHVRSALVVIKIATESQLIHKGDIPTERLSSVPSRKSSGDAVRLDFKMAYSKARDAYPNENLQFEHRIKSFEIILFCQMMLFEQWEPLWEHELEYFLKLPVVLRSVQKRKGIKYNAIVVFLHVVLGVLREAKIDLVSMICSRNQIIEELALLESLGGTQIGSKRTQLHIAAIEGNSDILKQVSQYQCELNVLDENGLSPLHYAVADNNVSCVRTLITAGADIEYSGEKNMTALHLAASSDDYLDCLKALISHGANIHAVMDDDNTPLHIAASKGAENCLQALIDAGANVNTRRRLDMVSPLHLAAVTENVDCVVALILNGADVEIVNSDACTPIHIAAEIGNLACLKELIFNGADVNARGFHGMAPLHHAAMAGKLDCLIALLDAGADVDCVESHWLNTPLCFAVRGKHLDCLKTLILYGADVNVKTKCENFVLQDAVVGGSLDCLIELIKCDANLNAQDYDGNTALHEAATEERLEFVKALVVAGADPTIRNNDGQCAHDRAKSINGIHSDCYEYLSKMAAAKTAANR